jgi:hypothetical protein
VDAACVQIIGELVKKARAGKRSPLNKFQARSTFSTEWNSASGNPDIAAHSNQTDLAIAIANISPNLSFRCNLKPYVQTLIRAENEALVHHRVSNGPSQFRLFTTK